MPHPILTDEELAGAQAPRLSRLEEPHHRHHLAARRGRGRHGARDRAHLRRGRAGDRRGLPGRGAVRSRGGTRARRDQRAARLRRGAPSPDPQDQAHAHRAGARDRGGARGPSPLSPDRLRRRRHQPLPRVREPVPRARARPALGREPRRRRGDRALPQGCRQGDAQGDGQDGDLDAPELQGSADLRGGRPARRGDRELLRRHREPHPGRRVRDPGQGGDPPPPARLSAAGPGPQVRAAQPRPHPLARQRRGAHVDAGDHRGDPGGGAHQQPRRLRAVRQAGQRVGHARVRAARSPEVQGPLRRRRAARGGRAGGEHRQALLHRRHELRLDLGRDPRDARRSR